MPTSILSRTILSLLDKKLMLNNSQWAATLDIGDNWTQIRIALRCCLTDTGGTIFGGGQKYFGLMSNPVAGLTNGPLTDVTSHFFGVNAGTTDMARLTSPVVHYNAFATSPCKKVGTTITNPGGGITGLVPVQATNIRVALVVELLKGSPWQLDWASLVLTAGLVDMPLASLKTAMVAATIANVVTALNVVAPGYQDHSGGTILVAVDEVTDGPLNAVCVGWSRTIDLEISEVLFVKMA